MLRRFAWITMVLAAGILPAGCGGEPGGDANERSQAAPQGSKDVGSGAVTMDLSLSPARTTALEAEQVAKVQKLINGGVAYLLSQRKANGGWSFEEGAMEPALTALVLRTLLGHPDFDRDNPVIKKGLDVILSHRQPDGAIFQGGQQAYTTAIAVMAMVAADDPRLQEAITGGVNYLKGIQIQPGQESPDGTPVAEDDPNIGGVGYGRNKTPNLSVLQFAVEAFHDANVPADDPAMQRTVRFLTQLQNRSESSDRKVVKDGPDDGGFPYDTVSSKAGMAVGGGMRSYGTMTYAGFKSMIYAGLAKDDPRVMAAYSWIRRYWRLDSNPNMPAQQSLEGLYYYYMMYARALQAFGRDEIKDFKKPDVMHNWRAELIDALGQRVQPNGSWANEESRWLETNPTLVTCYATMALMDTLKK